MKITELEHLYRQIESAMAAAQRASWRAISAHEIAGMLLHVPENQLRLHMDRLVAAGRLVKVGRGLSRGYRLATRAQRDAHLAKYAMRPRGAVVVTDYTEITYQEIEKVVGVAFRDLKRGVMPKDIQPRFPVYRAEGSLRRDMLAMMAAGRLIRISGIGARQGYRLPTKIERLAFTVNQGMWPHGAEQVMSWA